MATASRLNFSTGAIVNPLEGLQQATAQVGTMFDKYVQREQDREDRLAREAEDRRRYETQLGRYDRQEQESLRRYEEGKELNKLEREEMRKRYEIADARQAAADKRAEEDQKRQNWTFGKQQEEYGQKEKARSYSMDSNNASRLAEWYAYNTPAFESLSQGISHLGTVRNDLAEKAAAAKSVGDINTASRLEAQADKVLEEQTALASKATELGKAAVRDVDTNALTRMVMFDARDKGIQLTEDQARSAALGLGTDYSAINKTRSEDLKENIAMLNAIKRLPNSVVGTVEENGEVPQTRGGKTLPLVAVTTGEDGKSRIASAIAIPKDYQNDDWKRLVGGDTQWEKAKEGVNTVLQTQYETDKQAGLPFDSKAATQAAKLALVAGKSGSSGDQWDEATAKEVFRAFYEQARGAGKGLEGKEDELMSEVLDRVTRLSTPRSEASMQGRRLADATSAYEEARKRVGGYLGREAVVPANKDEASPTPSTAKVITGAGISPTRLQLAPKEAASVLQQVKSNPELDAMYSALADAGVAPNRRLVLLKQVAEGRELPPVRLTPQEQANKEAKELLRNSYNSLDAAIVDPAMQYVRRLGGLAQ